MAGVFIYKNALEQYASFVSADDKTYIAMKSNINENKSDEVVWEKGNVKLQQIEDSRKTKNDLIKRLNNGEEVDLEKELSIYFN